jgi:hypothetical protein
MCLRPKSRARLYVDELFLLAVSAENSRDVIRLLQLWLGHIRLTSATILHLPGVRVNPDPREESLKTKVHLQKVCRRVLFSSNSANSIAIRRLVSLRTPGSMFERKRERPRGPKEVVLHRVIREAQGSECLCHPSVLPPNRAPCASALVE